MTVIKFLIKMIIFTDDNYYDAHLYIQARVYLYANVRKYVSVHVCVCITVHYLCKQ